MFINTDKMIKIFCPNCYNSYDEQPEECECGYPFNGSDMDKFKFMSVKVKRKKIEKEAVDAFKYSRVILFFIGGLNAIFSIYLIFISTENTFNYSTFASSITPLA